MKKTLPIFFAIAAISLLAQETRLEQISTAQGLSQSNVTCMTYDQHGFLWIGTDDGLNRYDGYDFKIYEYTENDPHSLPSSAIRSIFKSRNGTLWIGTVGGGLARYDQDLDGFVVYKNIPTDKNSLSDNMILAIAEDHTDNLWVGTEKGGLNRLSFDQDGINPTITSYRTSDSLGLNHNYVHSIHASQSGDLIIGTWGGINILKKDRNQDDIGSFESIRADVSSGLTHNAVRTILDSDQPGEYWLGTWGGGLNRLQYQEGKYIIDNDYSQELKSATEVYKYISTLYKDLNGHIWIGSFELGMTIYDPINNLTKKYTNDDLDHNYISSNFVSSFVSDSSGITWVGTYGGGLNKYDDVEQPFKLFQQSDNADYQLSNNLVFSITQDSKDNIWVGTHGGGLNKLKKTQEGYTLQEVYRAGTIPSDIVLTIVEDVNERIWLGTREGLAIYNSEKKVFSLIPNQHEKKDGFWGKFIWKIYRDAQDNMWVGTRRGLNKWDAQSNKFSHFNHIDANSKSLSNDNVYTILEDSRGYLWVGTADGLNLNVENGEKNEFLKFRHFDEGNSIIGSTIYAIEEDSEGRIWVGTNRGLSCLDLDEVDTKFENIGFRNFTVEDGLIDNVFYGILLDDNGDIWTSSNEGLSHFNPEELLTAQEPQSAIYNYDQSDGLQSNEFNMGAFFKNEEGILFFGGNNGISAFDPTRLIRNTLTPAIVIASITVNNEERPIPSDGNLALTWRDHALTIEYAALNYRKNTKNRYAYQMKGVDAQKTYANNRRYVNYTNLSPGEYEFNVQGSNNDDIWNNEGTSLKIKVLPPPWKTWWAYCVYFGLIAASFLSYGRYKSVQEQRKLKLQSAIEKAKFEERERVRKKSSQDFHDELGNRITKISLLLGILKSKITDIDSKKIVSKASENTHELSSGLKDFIWMLDPDKERISDLVDRLVLFGNTLFDHSVVVFSADITSANLSQTLDIEVRKHLILFFKEAMNNALKYAKASAVTLSVYDKVDQLVFTLTDDGVGFDQESILGGNGLSNMRNRTKEIGGNLVIESAIDKGTKVILRMKNFGLK